MPTPHLAMEACARGPTWPLSWTSATGSNTYTIPWSAKRWLSSLSRTLPEVPSHPVWSGKYIIFVPADFPFWSCLSVRVHWDKEVAFAELHGPRRVQGGARPRERLCGPGPQNCPILPMAGKWNLCVPTIKTLEGG